MEKAYDLKALGQKIREKAQADGLHIAEEAIEKLAKAAYVGFKEWTAESAALSTNKIDDMFIPALGFADALVLPQIEAIDLDGDGQ